MIADAPMRDNGVLQIANTALYHSSARADGCIILLFVIVPASFLQEGGLAIDWLSVGRFIFKKKCQFC